MILVELLGDTPKIRILQVFVENFQEELTVREISRIGELEWEEVQKHMPDLVRYKFVRRTVFDPHITETKYVAEKSDHMISLATLERGIVADRLKALMIAKGIMVEE